MPLLRLTRREYQNTLRDLALVDDAAVVAADLPADVSDGHGFELAPPVSRTDVERLQGAAEQVGRAVAARLSKLLPCDPAAAGEEACARQLVVSFGRRAYRRPLAADEVDALVAYYRRVRSELGYDFAGGVRVVVQVMLQSPSFLYHWERGPAPATREGGLVRLGADELAARLSYFLWSTMPDARLFQAADAGRLRTAADVASEARRMLADARARDTIRAFHEALFGLPMLASAQKDQHLFAAFTPELAGAMQAETTAFVASVFAEDRAPLETLLAAPYTFANGALAQLYGLPGVSGSNLRRVPLDPSQRLGALTQASLLTLLSLPEATSPVRRGKFVLSRILCAPPPPPPPDVMASPLPVEPGLTRRAQYEAYAAVEPCRSCHVRMNAIGFAFEAYDAIGRFRTTDAGKPIDTAIALDLDGATRSFAGAPQLANALSRSPQVQECMTRQWLRYALRRDEADAEAGSVAAAHEAFAAAGFDLRALVAAITTTRAFLYRAPAPEEN
jgi:hypothetical protein